MKGVTFFITFSIAISNIACLGITFPGICLAKDNEFKCFCDGEICKFRHACKKGIFGGFSCKNAELYVHEHSTCRNLAGCHCRKSLAGERYCSFGQICDPHGVEGYECIDSNESFKFKCPSEEDLTESSPISGQKVELRDCVCRGRTVKPGKVCGKKGTISNQYDFDPKDKKVVQFRLRKSEDTDLRKFVASKIQKKKVNEEYRVIHNNGYFKPQQVDSRYTFKWAEDENFKVD